jgi:hypothetical protein
MATRKSGYKRIEGDHYATPAWVVQELLTVESFDRPIWEPAPGEGHMVRALQAAGHEVVALDIDFLSKRKLLAPSIVTNPPFSLAERFCRHAISLTLASRGKVAMLLPIAWDAAKTRSDLFRGRGFKAKYTLTRRIRWENLEQKQNGPSSNHAWFVWDWMHEGPARMGWLPEQPYQMDLEEMIATRKGHDVDELEYADADQD